MMAHNPPVKKPRGSKVFNKILKTENELANKFLKGLLPLSELEESHCWQSSGRLEAIKMGSF